MSRYNKAWISPDSLEKLRNIKYLKILLLWVRLFDTCGRTDGQKFHNQVVIFKKLSIRLI